MNCTPVAIVPPNRGQNMSLCAIISTDGVEYYDIIVGGYKMDDFTCFITNAFIHGVYNDDALLMTDNCAIDRAPRVIDHFLLYNVDLLFLLPYSPQLNPMENSFGALNQSTFFIFINSYIP